MAEGPRQRVSAPYGNRSNVARLTATRLNHWSIDLYQFDKKKRSSPTGPGPVSPGRPAGPLRVGRANCLRRPVALRLRLVCPQAWLKVGLILAYPAAAPAVGSAAGPLALHVNPPGCVSCHWLLSESGSESGFQAPQSLTTPVTAGLPVSFG